MRNLLFRKAKILIIEAAGRKKRRFCCSVEHQVSWNVKGILFYTKTIGQVQEESHIEGKIGGDIIIYERCEFTHSSPQQKKHPAKIG